MAQTAPVTLHLSIQDRRRGRTHPVRSIRTCGVAPTGVSAPTCIVGRDKASGWKSNVRGWSACPPKLAAKTDISDRPLNAARPLLRAELFQIDPSRFDAQ